MKKAVILSEFDGRKRGRVSVDLSAGGRTKQSMKEECDVNVILSRFRATGLVQHLAKGQPQYMDVSAVGDYRQALEHVRQVGEFFHGLPSDMRAEYGNDPAQFLDFVNSASPEELQEAGLVSSGSDSSGPPRRPDGRFVSEELDSTEGVEKKDEGGVRGSGGDVSRAQDTDGDV